MDCIFYWDPSDVQMAQRFCQVLQIDSTFKDNVWGYSLLEIIVTTNEMNIFLIAQAMIQSESTETLVWVFEQVLFHAFIVSEANFSSMNAFLMGDLVLMSF